MNGSVCAAGLFTNSGSLGMTNFAVWNGSAWSAAGNLNGSGVRVISAGTNLYLGGSFTVAGGVWANEIASWDGTRWSALTAPGRWNGVQAIVTALASDGTNLYAGGSFTYAGRTNASYVARFDGKNWLSLGPGLNGQVSALAVTNNRVYAGGYFTATTDGTALPYLGCWDGTNWNSLGSAGGLVYALAMGPNGLYAAGTYYTGTQYGSPFFNRWDGASWHGVLSFSQQHFFRHPAQRPDWLQLHSDPGHQHLSGWKHHGFYPVRSQCRLRSGHELPEHPAF